MKFGVTIFPTGDAIRIDHLARACEERGFESLFVSEHSHIPASRRTPWPMGGAELPREYWTMVDPFVGLAMAAGVTSKLMLGTAICLVIQRDPIITAKEAASLDHLSGGTPDLRHRRGLERGGDGESRDLIRRPLGNRAGEDRSDKGDLEPSGRQLPRPLRQLRSDLERAEAGPQAPSADSLWRPGSQGDARRDRVLRRLAAGRGAGFRLRRPPNFANWPNVRAAIRPR